MGRERELPLGLVNHVCTFQFKSDVNVSFGCSTVGATIKVAGIIGSGSVVSIGVINLRDSTSAFPYLDPAYI